jgi:nucleoside-diphosphate-sugar epimerase
MKILVTGSAGFIGSHVVAAAESAGHDVDSWDITDGRDARHLALRPVAVDAVVHCAATTVTSAAKALPGLAVAGNIEIDAAVFRWAALHRPGRFVYLSSSCAYPAVLHVADVRLHEQDIDLRRPQWPDGLYGWAKLTGELQAAALAESGVPVTVLRPFSVYGPGMRDGFAVSSVVGQVAAREPAIELWGSGSQLRDFVHVSDVAAAVLAVIAGHVDGTVNVGTGRPVMLSWLAAMAGMLAGYEPAVTLLPGMPEGPASLVADASRLRSLCEPKIVLEQGLARMLAGEQ